MQYAYDAAHRLTGVTDTDGNSITYTLDGAGNRVAEAVRDPSSTLTQSLTRTFNTLGRLEQQVGSAGQTTSYTYDGDGNVRTETDPYGRVTSYGYDELDRLSLITDPMLGLTDLAYDGTDNLLTVTDPRSLTTSYAYNGLGDQVGLTSPDTGASTFTFDASGELATGTDARSTTGTYGYDAARRVTSITYPGETIAFTYDQGTNGAGHLTGLTDSSGTTAWTYDAEGRVLTRTGTSGPVTLTVGYGYNASGQLVSLTTPSGQSIAYSYTSGRLSALTVNGVNLLSGVTYEPFGPTRGWQWGNGTATQRTYDTDGQITQVSSAGTSTYEYYPDGRIKSRADDFTVTLPASPGTTTFSVAAASNHLTGASGALARTYSYDAAGHTLGDGARTFTYDDTGRMATSTAAGVTTSYLYNGLGERVKKSNTGVTRYFAYDEAGHLLGEYDSSGDLVQETVWLGDIPVATLVPDGQGGVDVYYIHTDHLNTPRRITRPGDNIIVWRWDSEPFGATPADEDPDGDSTAFTYNLRFPGQYLDDETGLHYNYFRDYDPVTGRYVESDPIGLHGGINTYGYASANPITNFDPSGLDCQSAGGRTICTYPGGPSFNIPTPPNFPAHIGPSNLLYHSYDVSVSEKCLDNNMLQGLINNPAPGNPMSPATAGGTPNVAQALGVNNPIISYVTNDLVTGNPIVVNVTTGTQLQGFSPGYVARTVSNGVVNNYGEGLALIQSPLLFSPVVNYFLDQYVWRKQTNSVAKKCGCN